MVDWGMHPTRSPVRAQPFTTVLCICRVCDQQCDPQPDITMYDICRSGNCNVILARVLLFGWGYGVFNAFEKYLYRAGVAINPGKFSAARTLSVNGMGQADVPASNLYSSSSIPISPRK